MNEAIEIGVDESLKVNGDATALFENLAKAQLEFIPVPRDSAGQVGANRSFKYAGYATIMRCIRPALSKYGIAVLQPLHFRGGMAITTTIVAGHGASIQTSFAFKADFTKRSKEGTPLGDDPQEFGRCHTYYRRYQPKRLQGSNPQVTAEFQRGPGCCGTEDCSCSGAEVRAFCNFLRAFDGHRVTQGGKVVSFPR